MSRFVVRRKPTNTKCVSVCRLGRIALDVARTVHKPIESPVMLVPHEIPEEPKTMCGTFLVIFDVRISNECFRICPGMPRLRYDHLILIAGRLEVECEAAQKAS